MLFMSRLGVIVGLVALAAPAVAGTLVTPLGDTQNNNDGIMFDITSGKFGVKL